MKRILRYKGNMITRPTREMAVLKANPAVLVDPGPVIRCPHCDGTRIDDRVDLAPYYGCTDCGFQFRPQPEFPEPNRPLVCDRCDCRGFVRVQQDGHPAYYMCARCRYLQ